MYTKNKNEIKEYLFELDTDILTKACNDLNEFEMKKTPLIKACAAYLTPDYGKKICVVSKSVTGRKGFFYSGHDFEENEITEYTYYEYNPSQLSVILNDLCNKESMISFDSTHYLRKLLTYKPLNEFESKVFSDTMKTINILPQDKIISLDDFNKEMEEYMKFYKGIKAYFMAYDKKIKDESKYKMSRRKENGIKNGIKEKLISNSEIENTINL